ncbi:unnamed protein product [Camellia sinensis]
MVIIHGLNEHSGRYADFARQLNSCNFGVYAMDWIGHGGSDGLHGYMPSLDHVVVDTRGLSWRRSNWKTLGCHALRVNWRGCCLEGSIVSTH